jgi:hypothetical protein
MRTLQARLDLRIIHRAETIAAYGGALGAVKEEDSSQRLRFVLLMRFEKKLSHREESRRGQNSSFFRPVFGTTKVMP